MSLPPIHPALVHLPLALVTVSFFADLFARTTRKESLRNVGLWTLIGAVLGGGLTILAGYWDMNRAALNGETHEYVDLHLKIGWALAISLVVLAVWRWRIRQQARLPSSSYLIAALLVFVLTTFQGWFGGEMVYSHGAGVAAAGQGMEEPAKAQARLARVKNLLEPGQGAGAPGKGSESQQGAGHK